MGVFCDISDVKLTVGWVLMTQRLSMIFGQSFKQYTNSTGGSGILYLGQNLVGRLVMDRVSMIFGQRFKQHTDATDGSGILQLG